MEEEDFLFSIFYFSFSGRRLADDKDELH